jgi:hypothetical protein
MVVLNFTLTPEAASKIHDLLVCLGKFSDTVAIEARREKVGYLINLPFKSHLSYPTSVHIHRAQFIKIRLRRRSSRRQAVLHLL